MWPGLEAASLLATEVASLSEEAARALAAQLQAVLAAREVQLERQFREIASMEDVTQQLMVSGPSAAKTVEWLKS